jgi:hypothetical protein
MMRTSVTLMALGSLALMASAASAQNESRGYGGPLYVGPNFEKGGQHTTPDYGFKSSKKAVIKRETAKVRKAPVSREVATTKEAPPVAAEKEAAAPAAADTSKASPATETAASSGPATCKRFEPTAGQTITVPCQ